MQNVGINKKFYMEFWHPSKMLPASVKTFKIINLKHRNVAILQPKYKREGNGKNKVHMLHLALLQINHLVLAN